MSNQSESRSLPSAIYVWIVPSEEVLDQPGNWRIRKWDTAPFPEANFTLPLAVSETETIYTAAHLVPTSWLDPLLTGPDAVLKGMGPWPCQDIERLLNAIRARIADAQSKPNRQGAAE